MLKITVERNEVILFKYYHDEQELDVFLNTDKIQTFYCSVFLLRGIEEMLKKLGHKSFKKQQFQSRLKN